ncbi:MAG: transglycosylase domain-containing protein [Clostridia bacterium]|nr:transglycosylase domain-containing protein [Clostridia bacterium]
MKKGSTVRKKLALIIVLSAFAAAAVGAACFFRFHEWQRFDIGRITSADRSAVVLDSEGQVIAVVSGAEKRLPIRISELSETTKFAFVSAEDARFYEHSGIDIRRIFGAAWADIKALSLKQGASTIGQQLIKLSHLSGEKTFGRKLEEAVLTTRMEAELTKDEILELYLNYVYFGGGFYGIETAALGYFGVHASELSAAQAAQLAGILKAPALYAPHLDPERSLERRNTVLSLMAKYGHLSEEECVRAKNEPCILINGLKEERTAFIDYALAEAAEKLGITRAELLRSGCRICTTLESGAEAALTAIMEDDRRFPTENAQAACVLLRSDGGIAAMCGGRGEDAAGGFNRAAAMERQPGSLIKPILCYAPAIESLGCTGATVLEDRETDFSGYAPTNAGGKYYGAVTLRFAVSESLNVPAVAMLRRVGTENAVAFAEKLGISFENEHIGLALALGGFTRGVSPLEMAGAYNCFNTGGEYFAPFAVATIELDGATVYEHAAEGRRVMRAETAFIMADILRSAVTDGTAGALSGLGFPIAAKTGTNLDEAGGVRDVWTAAFAGDYTACLWVGTDSAALGSLPAGTTGGNCACPLLAALFSALPAERTADIADRKAPDGVVLCRLDGKTLLSDGVALLATAYTPPEDVIEEYFPARSAPREESTIWRTPEPPSVVGWLPDADGNPVIGFTAGDARLRYELFRCGKNGEGERLIAELGGQTGGISYTDFTAVPGETYFYWIRTVNPLIAAAGGEAVSAPSRRMRVVVPYTGAAG